jgi:hypothetical protein
VANVALVDESQFGHSDSVTLEATPTRRATTHASTKNLRSVSRAGSAAQQAQMRDGDERKFEGPARQLALTGSQSASLAHFLPAATVAIQHKKAIVTANPRWNLGAAPWGAMFERETPFRTVAESKTILGSTLR